MSPDEQFMHQALIQAQFAFEKNEVPIGAIVTIKNQIIARAYNLSKTLNDPTAHAEMQAFTAATNYLGGNYLDECTLYVTLEPCAMCAGASFWVQIGKIVYGATDKKRGIGSISNKIIHPKTEIIGGILAQESELLLQNFFKSKR